MCEDPTLALPLICPSALFGERIVKNVSFMVALLAVVQILTSSRLSQAQDLRLKQDRQDDRRTFEEALDVAGQDIGEELEELFEQLDATSQKLGQKIERWAEENSDELSAWSKKYGDQWEEFGEKFGSTVESVADDQQGIWSRWAERYERDMEQWGNDLEQDQMTGEDIGRFIDNNLEALSKMPLGKLVDQVLEDGVDELRNAPWESLDELGLLAKDALQEPLEELAELTVDGAKTRRALNRSAREMGRSLDRLKDDIGRNISDSDLLDLIDSESLGSNSRTVETDPRIIRLKELMQKDGVTEQQRQSIEDMIDVIRSSAANSGQANERPRRSGAKFDRTADVPRRDQIIEKIEREKKRHAQALESFNMDLQKSAENSHKNQRQKSEIQWREKNQRNRKSPSGKNLDSQPRSSKTDQLKYFRDGDGRQPRSQKQNSRRASNRKSSHGKSDPAQIESLSDDEEDRKTEAIEVLLRQVEELRKEVESLKQDRS